MYWVFGTTVRMNAGEKTAIFDTGRWRVGLATPTTTDEVVVFPEKLSMVNAPADFIDWRFDKFIAWEG